MKPGSKEKFKKDDNVYWTNISGDMVLKGIIIKINTITALATIITRGGHRRMVSLDRLSKSIKTI